MGLRRHVRFSSGNTGVNAVDKEGFNQIPSTVAGGNKEQDRAEHQSDNNGSEQADEPANTTKHGQKCHKQQESAKAGKQEVYQHTRNDESGKDKKEIVKHCADPFR